MHMLFRLLTNRKTTFKTPEICIVLKFYIDFLEMSSTTDCDRCFAIMPSTYRCALVCSGCADCRQSRVAEDSAIRLQADTEHPQ